MPFGPKTGNRASEIIARYPRTSAAASGRENLDLGPADGPKCVSTCRRPRRGPKFCSPKLLRHSERTRPDGKHLAQRGSVESPDFGPGANWPWPPPRRVFERRLRCPPGGRIPGRPLPAARVSTRPAARRLEFCHFTGLNEWLAWLKRPCWSCSPQSGTRRRTHQRDCSALSPQYRQRARALHLSARGLRAFESGDQ